MWHISMLNFSTNLHISIDLSGIKGILNAIKMFNDYLMRNINYEELATKQPVYF